MNTAQFSIRSTSYHHEMARLTARGLRRQWSCVTLNSRREPSYLEHFRGMLRKIGTNPVREIHAAAGR